MQGLINWGPIVKCAFRLTHQESISDFSINLKIQIRQNSFISNVWSHQWRQVDQMELFMQAKDSLQKFWRIHQNFIIYFFEMWRFYDFIEICNRKKAQCWQQSTLNIQLYNRLSIQMRDFNAQVSMTHIVWAIKL